MAQTTESVTRAPRRQPTRLVRFEKREGHQEKKKRGQRLSHGELVTIATLHKEGVSIRGIADTLSRTEATISLNLKSSLQLLQAFAPDFVTDWKQASSVASTRGDHRPAMDALERLKVVERPKADFVPPIQINVGIALPGLPSPQPALPDIALQAKPDVNTE